MNFAADLVLVNPNIISDNSLLLDYAPEVCILNYYTLYHRMAFLKFYALTFSR